MELETRKIPGVRFTCEPLLGFFCASERKVASNRCHAVRENIIPVVRSAIRKLEDERLSHEGKESS